MDHAPQTGYYSSAEKDAVREHFDTPLIRSLRERVGDGLRYFGLPGEDALDIRTWQPFLSYVAAVERRRASLEKLETLLDTQFPNIQYSTHWGELDKVILTNRGKMRMVGGQDHRPWVSTWYRREIQGYVWEFDILNLDYFGPFLPFEPNHDVSVGGRARERAAALRRLFALDRQDAWRSWTILVTVEAELVGQQDRDVLRQYLNGARADSSPEASASLDFLLSVADTAVREAARLVHGATAVLVATAASDANLRAFARGTVLYRGAHGQPMIHLAYDFEPVAGTPLAPPASRSALLRAPILRPTNPLAAPWLELLERQGPGVTAEDVRNCLSFLRPEEVQQIILDGQGSLESP